MSTQPFTKPIRKIAYTITLSSCIMVSITLFCVVRTRQTAPASTPHTIQVQAAPPMPSNESHDGHGIAELRSDAPFHAVVVPFANHNGHIVVQAKINQQVVECLIDTGNRDVSWTGIALEGQPAGSTGIVRHFTDNIPFTGFWLNRVDIGAYTLHNVYSVHQDNGRPCLFWDGSGIPVYVVLGNYAFQHVILTIDCPHHRLILRDTTYDIRRVPRKQTDSLININYESGYAAYKEYGPGLLYIDAKIAGQPAPAILDTGYNQGILLSAAFRKRLTKVPADRVLPLPYTPAKDNAVTAQTSVPLHWSLGAALGQSPCYVLNGLFPTKDLAALIGCEALRNYRITIDYGRKKMLLERVGSTTNEFNKQRLQRLLK